MELKKRYTDFDDVMHEFADTQEYLNEVAAVDVQGMKKQKKRFWKAFENLQFLSIEFLKALKTYKEIEVELPFFSDEFKKVWKQYRVHFFEVRGYFMSETSEENQLWFVSDTFGDDEKHAIMSLRYIIMKGDTHIYPVTLPKTDKEKAKEKKEKTLYKPRNPANFYKRD